MEGLVIYHPEDCRHVVGVNEFEVAKCVILKQLSKLSTAECGWHLFDMCLWFGHVNVAWAMAEAGTEGCVVEDYHLGPYAWNEEEEEEEAEDDDLRSNSSWSNNYRPSLEEDSQTDDSNAWGFPSSQGIWMKDWNYKLEMAEEAAQKASVRPLYMRILEYFRAGWDLPFSLSSGAMARLLDIAIFVGDQEAASTLAGLTQVRPLRSWEMNLVFFFSCFGDYWDRPMLLRRDALVAALAAGANLGREQLEGFTLREVLVFTGEWADFEHLVPDEDNQPKRNCDWDTGEYFGLESWDMERNRMWTLCTDTLHQAMLAGLALHTVQVKCYKWKNTQLRTELPPLSLLDVAILQGQRESAEICAAAGVGVKVPQMLSTNDEMFLDRLDDLNFPFESIQHFSAPLADRREAASHAAQTALRSTLRSELREKGTVLCKVWPEELVPRILAFAMEEPQLVRTLMEDFLVPEDVVGWERCEPTWRVPPVKVSEAKALPAQVEATEDLSGEAGEVDEKATDDIMTALRESQSEVPPLNMDGVCLFRLTRNSRGAAISDLLLDATGPLAALHERVLTAGCEVAPEWSLVRAIFIPFSREQLAEFQGIGYELCDQHILALRDDQDLIVEALRANIRKKHRPNIEPARRTQQHDPSDEAMPSDEPPLLLEAPTLRTDSSVGYPSWRP